MKRNAHSLGRWIGGNAITLFLVLGCKGLLWTQVSATPPNAQANVHPLPKDANSLAGVLASLNGLDRSGAQSFHIKLAYDHFDSDGDNDSSGTYEEWWAGPKKYKRVYTRDNLNRTEWATEQGLFVAGDQKWPRPYGTLWIQVTDPLYRISRPRPSAKLDRAKLSIRKVKLACIVERRTDRNVIANALVKYCFEPDEGELRYISGNGSETTYNQIVQFRDRYVAKDVEVAYAGKRSLQIHLETLEPDFQAAELKPSADAVLVGNGIYVPLAMVLEGDPLPFPMNYDGPSGKADVTITVDTDGHGRVIDAKVVEGPGELLPAVSKVAGKIKFLPFIVSGAPVEVKTTIHLSIITRDGGVQIEMY